MTLENALVAAVGALASCLGIMWRHQLAAVRDQLELMRKAIGRLEKKHDECEEDRAHLWRELAKSGRCPNDTKKPEGGQ